MDVAEQPPQQLLQLHSDWWLQLYVLRQYVHVAMLQVAKLAEIPLELRKCGPKYPLCLFCPQLPTPRENIVCIAETDSCIVPCE